MVQLCLEVLIFRLETAQFSQCFDSVVELFDHVLAFAPEKERFWVVGCHVHDLLRDGDDGLVLLHLELAHDQVGEARQLERVELAHGRLVLLTFSILFLEVVRHVAEVEVAIDFLVDLRCLLLIAFLEELSCSCLQAHQDLLLVHQGVLVEVARVLDAK